MRATAEAHPNIALIKYWGKLDRPGNLPAVGSLSITLDTLRSRTVLEFDPGLDRDRVDVAGETEGRAAERVAACLRDFRDRSGWPHYARVESGGNFPLAAGLASSASGFAALVVAADAAAGTALPLADLTRLAGAASGSAARSLHGGFVRLEAPGDGREEIEIRQLAEPGDWPLEIVVAVTDAGAKPVGSTEAMRASAATSPYYERWVREQPADLDDAEAAVRDRDFGRLAELAEFNCLKMHALTLTSRPAVIYWKPATLACIHRVRQLRADGLAAFFTVDAGPQVKAVCLPHAADAVAGALAEVPGVREILRCGLGAGARVLERE